MLLTDFHGTRLCVCCVTNSTWIVHLMVSPRIIERILHQRNLESTGVFFNGQKEMEELIKQPAPECWKMHFRGSTCNSKNFLGGMPLDPLDTQALWAFRYLAIGHVLGCYDWNLLSHACFKT